jgi:hypothetical protein
MPVLLLLLLGVFIPRERGGGRRRACGLIGDARHSRDMVVDGVRLGVCRTERARRGRWV